MSERFLDKIFQAFEDVAVQQEQSAPIVPSDGDDMTWNETDNPLTYAALVAQVYRLQNEMAGLAAQVVEANAQVVETQRSILRMIEIQERHATNTLGTAQNLQSLAAQVVELRERVQAWEADS